MPDQKAFLSRQIKFSQGTGNNLGRAKNLALTFRRFTGLLSAPLVTPEKRSEYLKMNDRRQAHLKGQNGWIMRAHVEKGSRRRDAIYPGQLISLDVDYATPEWMEMLLAGEILPGTAFAAHTTRSHTPEKPRARLFIPTSDDLPADQYQAACRIVAQLSDPDMQYTDKVSARVAQMMYLPTVSKDMEKHFVFHLQEGELLSWAKEVRAWEKRNGSADDIGNLPRFPGENELRESAEAAEDPLAKDGPVGTFCRAYSITELVTGKEGEEEPLLGNDYEPTEWHQGTVTRMTYSKGTTSNGAVVYDDKFVYSHHGSDPAQDRLLNAYDLVRYHLFNAEEDDEDAPLSQRASIKAMKTWMKDQPGYKGQLVSEKYDETAYLNDDDDMSWVQTGDDEDDDEEDLIGGGYEVHSAAQRAKEAKADAKEMEALIGFTVEPPVDRYKRMVADKPKKNWVASDLELTPDGFIKSTLHNVAMIVRNDARLFRKIAFNEFSKQIVLLKDIATKSEAIPRVVCHDPERGMLWDDFYDITIRAILEGPNGRGKPGYGIKVSDRDLVGGVKIAARNNSFHPIKDFLQEAREREWDGVDRISDFFHRYLGTEKNEYHAEVFRMMMIASVERIERPGCKFDYACIFEGATGIGKSTLIKAIYGADYFGELDADLADRRATSEQLQGKWAMELPELSALHKADHNHAKQFMRRQDDDVREAYGRNVSRFPRQTVFWGTTNDSLYLRDPTGNRSYWVVKCDVDSIDISAFLRERDQLWAQVVREHAALRREYPSGDLPLTLSGDVLREAQRLQERARTKELWEQWLEGILDWANDPVSLESLAEEMGWADVGGLDDDDGARMVRRVAFTQKQAIQGALDFREGVVKTHAQNTDWQKITPRLTELGYTARRSRIRGTLGRWNILPWATEEDLERGFVWSDEADAQGESSPSKPSEPEDLI